MYKVVGSDGQVYGPASEQELIQWIQEGRIQPTTNLIDPMDGRVFPAQTHPELAQYFNPGQAQAPPALQSVGQPSVPAVQTPPPSGPPTNVGDKPVQVNTYVNVNQVAPQVPYAVAAHPARSRTTAALLCFFLGGMGIHRFYLGYTGTGIVMLLIPPLTCGWGLIFTVLWALVDFILILTRGMKDAQGNELTA